MQPEPNQPEQDPFEKELAEAQAGSKEALGKILEALHRVLLQQARRLAPKDLRAIMSGSDLLQETFLEAGRDIQQFRGKTREEFVAWLLAILTHKDRKLVRAYRLAKSRERKREVHLDDPATAASVEGQLVDQSPAPPAELIKNEDIRLVNQIWATLPEPYRLVLRLGCNQASSWREIGDALGCSEDAARMLFDRARDFFEQQLRQHGFDPA